MGLVWVVIPLVLVGFIGMQESFAEESEFPLIINYFEVLDNSDNIITEIGTGYPIVIKSEIKNNESLLVDYTILCQIQDELGVTHTLNIIDDSIQGNSLKTSSYLWVPQVAGEYTIGCFVWESIDNPTELAMPQTMSLSVKEEKSYASNLGIDFTKTIDLPSITLQNTGIFKDLFYSDLNKPTQGIQLLLTSDIVNTKNKLIPFTYVLQIENEQQEVVYYSQTSTSLYSQETHKIIDSWIPQDFGNFTVKSMALDKTYRGDFLPLSESNEFKILVNEDPTFGLECPYCPTTSRIGEVQWREASYPLNSTGIVRVIDRDNNLDPELIDNHFVKVWSDSDSDGIDLIVTETNEGTGIFEGSVFFTTNENSSGDKLRVSNGDTVTAKYMDDALPEPYTIADELEIIGTTLVGTIGPPTGRPPPPNLRIIDMFGNSLDVVSTNQQVKINDVIANGTYEDQQYTYFVQIKDDNGVVVSLKWITMEISLGQSISPELPWIPIEAGTFTVTAFVWESVDNPVSLSPPKSTTIRVGESSSQITFSTDKEIYEIGESISITMENTGDGIMSGSGSPCGFNIFDKDENTAKSFWGVYLSMCQFEPGEKISQTWSAKSSSGVPIRSGIYTLSAQYWDSNHEQRFIFEKQIQIIDPNNVFEFLDSPQSSENIKMLKDSELVFSGKLITKTQISSSDAYDLEFEIIENFRNAKEDTVTVYTHEGSGIGCAGLEEDLDYLIFATPKTHGTITCYNAISLPTDVTDELQEFSSRIPWW